MDACVVGKLGMKRCRHDDSLPHQHRISVAFAEDFDAFTDLLDVQSANEDHLQRIVAEFGFSFEDGGVDLAAVGVALDGDVEGSGRAERGW